jgi:hypothetical protein
MRRSLRDKTMEMYRDDAGEGTLQVIAARRVVR